MKRCATNSDNGVVRVGQMPIEKWYRIDFNRTWSIIAIRKTNNRFHQNFQVGFKAHPLRYKGINLDISIVVESEVRTNARARMLAKVHIPARLLQHSIDWLITSCDGKRKRVHNGKRERVTTHGRERWQTGESDGRWEFAMAKGKK
jgi:hypothetical protein